MAETALGNEGALNGTTPVVLLAAPGASEQRIVRNVGFHNLDTAQVTITLRKLKGASTYVLSEKDLDAGDTWEYLKHVILDDTDESITAVMSGAAATTNPNFDVACLRVVP